MQALTSLQRNLVTSFTGLKSKQLAYQQKPIEVRFHSCRSLEPPYNVHQNIKQIQQNAVS